MIVSICIGRAGSKGFKDKNMYPIFKIPMVLYPINAAEECADIDSCFFSTDSAVLADLVGWSTVVIYRPTVIIDRPHELATDRALAEDVFVHAYEVIKKRYARLDDEIEFVVLLFANAPCVTPTMISEMIGQLRKHKGADAICTVSKYNMYSPNRMRRIDGDCLKPGVDMVCGTCDRDSAGDYYIYDCSCAVVRPRCLENIKEGLPPQKWLGKIILYYNECREIPALDVDYAWQIPQVEAWIRRYVCRDKNS